MRRGRKERRVFRFHVDHRQFWQSLELRSCTNGSILLIGAGKRVFSQRTLLHFAQKTGCGVKTKVTLAISISKMNSLEPTVTKNLSRHGHPNVLGSKSKCGTCQGQDRSTQTPGLKPERPGIRYILTINAWSGLKPAARCQMHGDLGSSHPFLVRNIQRGCCILYSCIPNHHCLFVGSICMIPMVLEIPVNPEIRKVID